MKHLPTPGPAGRRRPTSRIERSFCSAHAKAARQAVKHCPMVPQAAQHCCWVPLPSAPWLRQQQARRAAWRTRQMCECDARELRCGRREEGCARRSRGSEVIVQHYTSRGCEAHIVNRLNFCKQEALGTEPSGTTAGFAWHRLIGTAVPDP